MVMVKKASSKWRVWINFTDLNKACPKDSFPLPTIDRLMDASTGHKILNFMNTFPSFNQIGMNLTEQEKIMLIIENGLFYYKLMWFGLKNANATYQRLVNKVFTDKID